MENEQPITICHSFGRPRYRGVLFQLSTAISRYIFGFGFAVFRLCACRAFQNERITRLVFSRYHKNYLFMYAVKILLHIVSFYSFFFFLIFSLIYYGKQNRYVAYYYNATMNYVQLLAGILNINNGTPLSYHFDFSLGLVENNFSCRNQRPSIVQKIIKFHHIVMKY